MSAAHNTIGCSHTDTVMQLLQHRYGNALTHGCYHLVADAREWRLRFTASRTCVVTRTYSTFGDTAFGAAGPGLWNSLPSHMKDADLSYSEFRRSLKTFLFGQWGTAQCELVLTAPSRNSLTYLLTYFLKVLAIPIPIPILFWYCWPVFLKY